MDFPRSCSAWSLCAELIGNDKPLLCAKASGGFRCKKLQRARFRRLLGDNGIWSWTPLQRQLENRGWVLAPYAFGANTIILPPRSLSPRLRRNWLGTDANRRRRFRRTRTAPAFLFLFRLMLTICSSVAGRTGGARCCRLAAAKSGFTGQPSFEVWSGMPTLFPLLFYFPAQLQLLLRLLAITANCLPMSLRVGVVRAEFLRTLDYIRAAQALGVSDSCVLSRHMCLPNAMVATLTFYRSFLQFTTIPTSPDFLDGLLLGPFSRRTSLQGKTTTGSRLGIAALLSVAGLCRC